MALLAGCQLFSQETPDRRDDDGEPGDGRPQVAPGPDGLRSAWEGLVVPVAPGLTGDDVVDPAGTDTPVADALAAIDSSGDRPGFGTVLLPPTEIQEGAPIVPSQFIDIVGWGSHTSEIKFTDHSRDGFRINGIREGKFVTLDGFTLSGDDMDARTGGSALHFTGDGQIHPKHFDIGSLAFRDWVDPVVHCETTAPFDCVWGHLDFGYDANRGREIFVETEQSLMGTQIGFIGAGNATGDTVLHTDFAGLKVNIGFINIGGSAGQAVDINAASNGHLRIGGINFETNRAVDGPVVSVRGDASTRLEYVQNTNSEVRSLVELRANNGNNVIGPLRNNGTARIGKVEVTADSTAPSYYFGPSADVVPDSGVSGRVLCFGDMEENYGGARASSLREYSNASPADLPVGEVCLDTDCGGSGTAALLYKDGSGTVHRWNADTHTL